MRKLNASGNRGVEGDKLDGKFERFANGSEESITFKSGKVILILMPIN